LMSPKGLSENFGESKLKMMSPGLNQGELQGSLTVLYFFY